MASETLRAISSAAPKMMSRLLGKDEVSFQVILGFSWASAGAASETEAAAPKPAAPACWKNLRRFMVQWPWLFPIILSSSVAEV
ncbi:hypothetical protein D3C80_2089720 [compost metagenome]